MRLKYDRKKIRDYMLGIEEDLNDIVDIAENYKIGNNISRRDRKALERMFESVNEYIIKVCENLCVSNNLFTKNRTNVEKVTDCVKLGFITIEEAIGIKRIIKVRTDIVHEYWIDHIENIVDCVSEKESVMRDFYKKTLKLVGNENSLLNVELLKWVDNIFAIAPHSCIKDFGNTDSARALNYYLNLQKKVFNIEINELEANVEIGRIIEDNNR